MITMTGARLWIAVDGPRGWTAVRVKVGTRHSAYQEPVWGVTWRKQIGAVHEDELFFDRESAEQRAALMALRYG